jgi:hypothetical protein
MKIKDSTGRTLSNPIGGTVESQGANLSNQIGLLGELPHKTN